MSEENVVSRRLGVGLVMICIVLAILLVYAWKVVDERNMDIWKLHAEIRDKEEEISELLELRDTNTQLHSQIDELTAMAELSVYAVKTNAWTVSQPAGSYWWYILNMPEYAGYVSVNVSSSSTNTTYVRVLYNSFVGVDYDYTVLVGTNGTALFPILPSLHAEIRVGNNNLFDSASQTVTIVYVY